MYTSTTFLLALGLAGQQVAATWGGSAGGSWGGAKPFSCPGNTPTQCSPDQSGGFSWSGLNPGQSVSSYGGCGFTGVTCQAQGPGGKLKSKRTGGPSFSDKCVSGKISGDKGSCPTVHAGQGSGSGSTFSPTSYGVSCSYDTMVDFTYTMSDGSTCKHTSPCNAAGNTVQNTQCGGAVSVTCSQSDSEKKKNKGDCSLGFHAMGFQCGPATSITPPKSPSTSPASPPKSTDTPPKSYGAPPPKSTEEKSTETPPKSTEKSTETPPKSTEKSTETPPKSTEKSTETPPKSTEVSKSSETAPPKSTDTPPKSTEVVATTSPPGYNQPPPKVTTPVANSSVPVGSKPPTTAPQSAPPVETTPVATSKPVTTTYLSISTAFATTEITVTSCAPEITNCPAESRTPMVITKTLSQYTTVCPVTATMVPGESTLITNKPSSQAPPAETTPVATSKPESSAAAPSSSAAPPTGGAIPPNCPSVVPSCINTLLMSVQTQCGNNGDASCYCSAANHTQFIQECITSHGTDESEIQSALSFFQGLCAPQVPQNPSIVTHQPGGAPQAPSCPSNVPGTTITVQYTTTVPCDTGKPTAAPATPAPAAGTTPAAAPPAPSMTTISTQTVITVPQVQITTQPAASGATAAPTVALATGAPAAAPPAAAPPATAAPAYNTPAAATAAAATTTLASSLAVQASSGPVSPPIATGAAGKMGVSFGAVVMAAAVLL